MHAFRGMRGKKKSKLLTQLPFMCLANVQPQIQLKQFSETDMSLQDLRGRIACFLFPHSFLKLCSSLLLLSKMPLYPAADGKGCRCSQLVRNAQMLNRLFPPPWGLHITTEVGCTNAQIVTKLSHKWKEISDPSIEASTSILPCLEEYLNALF